MKLKALSAAVIAAGSLIASSAFALAPSAVTGNATLDVFLSGASAEDKLIQDLFSELCDAGSLDYFTDNSTNTAGVYTKVEGTSYNGARCTITENNALVATDLNGDGVVDTAKVDVFLRKRSAGGSSQGVVPVANNTAITFMNIVEGVGACGAGAAGTDPNGIPVWVCSNTNTVSQIPTGGVSDVEPALFAAAANGGAVFNAAEFSGSSVVSSTGVTFGVAVTKSLRDVLQAVQGKTIGSDNVSDMPSLSRVQIASIFAGKPSDWSSIQFHDTVNNVYRPLTQINAFNPALLNPTQTRINICTRTAGSGTRAQFNALFMNTPCDKANGLNVIAENTSASTAAAPTRAGTNTAIFTPNVPAVHENSGAGDLSTCLDNLNDGPVANTTNWGIGYNSLEKYSPKWRFVAIDGVAPTLKNVAEGKYFDVVANSFQWRATTNVPSVAQVNLIKKIATDAAKPTKLQISNSTDFSVNDFIRNDDGTNTASNETSVGYISLTKSFTGSIPFSQANPVNTWTRNGTGDASAPAACRTPALVKSFLIGQP